MSKLNFLFFMTTKGHFGRKDLYRTTINNFNRLAKIEDFDKFLSIKIFTGDQEEARKIIQEINYTTFPWFNPDKKITDESPYKDYAYYLLGNYLADIANVYSQKVLLNNEYTFLCEDDSPLIINNYNLEYYITKAISELEKDKNLFSVHFQRIGIFKEDSDYKKININSEFTPSHDYNFQNQVFRTKEMFEVANIIKANWEILRNVHTERAVKLAIDARNPKSKHISFNPFNTHSIHIGTQNSNDWINSYRP